MVGPILEALERKIGLRRDATRAPLRAPEWQRATSMPRPPRNTQISTRPRLTYCGPKLVLTKGSTLEAARKATKALRTGSNRKRMMSDNSHFINLIGVYGNHR